jgi:nucleoside-diphosphate-sugar epimerase
MTSDRILLTGVTGFLGGTVAAHLLREPRWERVLLLVRAASPQEAKLRVAKSLGRFESDAALLGKISDQQIICGGLDAMPSVEEDLRLAEVTHVINCAAITSFGQNPQTWPTNVDHTLAFARKVAAWPQLKRLIHVGTAMICGATPPPIVYEDNYPSAQVKHLVGYTGSKAAAETLLRRELVGAPLVFARPSIIIGHTQLGCKPSGSIFWGVRMADALGVVTCNLDAHVDVVPVDYVARALLRLMDARTLAQTTYHISAGRNGSSSFREIGQAFARARGQTKAEDYRQVSYQAVAARQGEFAQLLGPGNQRTMLAAARLYGAFAGLNTTFDNRRLLAEGIEPPPRFTDYLGVCVETSREIPISRQMMVDFE